MTDNESNGDQRNALTVEHFVVSDNEVSIQSVSELIYPMFTLENEIAETCSLRLAGCSIEETPILKLTYRPDLSVNDSVTRSIFVSPYGEFDNETANSLGLETPERLEGEPKWLRGPGRSDQLERLVETVSNSYDQFDPAAMIVIWCKHVEGKLLFRMPDDSREIKFSGWAKRFTNGREVCPPFLCDASGKSSYRVTADDDGRLTIPSAIRICSVSGKRLIETRIGQCCVTDQDVDHALLWVCPASGQKLIESYAASCRQCGQKVSPASMARGVCSLCQTLVKANINHPSIEIAKKEWPVIASATGWKIASCDTYSVIVCRRGLKRYLAVISGDGKCLTKKQAGFFGQNWQAVDPGDAADS